MRKNKKIPVLQDAIRPVPAIVFRLAARHMRTTVLACAVLTSVDVFAQESYPTVWLNPGFYSYHFDQDADLRENNIGFGAEIELKRNHVLTLGTFKNSDDERSSYGGYEWRPLHWQPAKTDVSAGLIFAALDGYPRVHDGDWFVAVLPMVSVQWKRLGFNLTVVPEIEDRLYGAIAIQIKLRVW